MNIGKKTALLFVLLCGGALANRATLGGYLEGMPFLSIPPGDSSQIHRNGLSQLRLNASWIPVEKLELNLAGRIVAYGGQDFHKQRMIASQLEIDPGIVDLRRAQWNGEIQAVLLEDVDRMNLVWSKDRFVLTVGRQRINWGTNLVWNPNDWFNAYDYLELAYPERPGSDAVRLQFYPAATSILEVVAQVGDDSLSSTYAALFALQAWNYDLKFQAGISGSDLVAGYSWAGDIQGAGFSGEASLYKPRERKSDGKPFSPVASVSLNYTFENSIFLQASALYNGYHRNVLDPHVAKRLIEKENAVFGEIAYPWSPLIQLDFAALISPEDGSSCLVPSATFSLRENLDLLLSGQFYQGGLGDLYGNLPDIVYGGLKLAF